MDKMVKLDLGKTASELLKLYRMHGQGMELTYILGRVYGKNATVCNIYAKMCNNRLSLSMLGYDFCTLGREFKLWTVVDTGRGRDDEEFCPSHATQKVRECSRLLPRGRKCVPFTPAAYAACLDYIDEWIILLERTGSLFGEAYKCTGHREFREWQEKYTAKDLKLAKKLRGIITSG